MPVVALPDILGALVARLRSFSEITALTSTAAGYVNPAGNPATRVSAQRGDNWKMPTHAVVLRLAGGPADDMAVRFKRTRVDVECFGPNAFEAARLWRTVDPALLWGASGLNGFRQAGCRVDSVEREGGPNLVTDDSLGWPFILSSYIVRWAELAVA